MAMQTLAKLQDNMFNVDDVIPLYESEQHSIYWVGSRIVGEEIACHTYLLVDEGEGFLFEPGGLAYFQSIYDKVSEKISPFNLTHLLMSHQDPDVCASIPSWLQFNPDIQLICSELWDRFLPHYMVYGANFLSMKKEGLKIPLKSGGFLQCISAPYLHSPGNMVVYDSISGYLVSGDIGAGIDGDGFQLVVDDWERHLQRMQGFHQRYMGSTRAAASFVSKVRPLNCTAILPQHGRIFRDGEVEKFLDWFEVLPCGVDVPENLV